MTTGVPEKKAEKRPATKVYLYRLPGDWIVLAGKTDADNDRLSLKIARPDDWWFHVRGLPGSHVVLRCATEPDRDTLKAAAAVAAYHSKARGGGVVAVSGTLARHVTKPPGAKPGTVCIRKEEVFKVKPAIPVDAMPLPTRLETDVPPGPITPYGEDDL